MKKLNLFSIVLDIVIILFLIISFFFFLPNFRTIYFEILNPCFWLIIFSICFAKIRKEEFKKKYKYDFLQIIVISLIIYFIIFYLLGFITGYTKLPYNHSILGILKNSFSYLIIVFFQEYIRQTLINRSGNNKVIFFSIVVIFSFVNIINFSYGYAIKNILDLFKYIYIIVIAELSKSLLLSYVTYKADFIPSFIYALAFQISIYIIPVTPTLNWFLEGSLKLLLPFFVYIACSDYAYKKQHQSQKRKKKNLLLLPFILIIIPLISLVSGIFKFQIIAIASNSMLPKYGRGDTVIFEKIDLEKKKNLKEKDIIVFKKDNQIILHRIEKIEYTVSKNKHYITKGDNNNIVDNDYIVDEDIIGIYRSSIPIIGYPSVWLKEILS